MAASAPARTATFALEESPVIWSVVAPPEAPSSTASLGLEYVDSLAPSGRTTSSA